MTEPATNINNMVKLSGTGGHAAGQAGRRMLGIWAARLTIAGLFVAAGVPKAVDPAGFAAVVWRYQLLQSIDPRLISIVAIVIPWLEIVGGLAILAPRRWRTAGGAMLISLLLVFTAGAFSAWWRGLEIPCGCFSTAATRSPVIGPWLLIRNLGLIGLVLVAMCHARAGAASSGAANQVAAPSDL